MNGALNSSPTSERNGMGVYSQFDEDEILCELCDLPDAGMFVDVGAGHWRNLSNTYAFELAGWNGLCIEADPRRIAELKANRKSVEHCAIAPHGWLFLAPHADNSTTLDHLPESEAVIVPHARLEDVLTRHGIGKIDLLSIDVEGAEEFVWHSFDHARHAPTFVIIEFLTAGTFSRHNEIRAMMEPEYRIIAQTFSNFIYQRQA